MQTDPIIPQETPTIAVQTAGDSGTSTQKNAQKQEMDPSVSAIILPQKNAPSAISTERMNAGTTFAAGSAPLQQSTETQAAISAIASDNAALHVEESKKAPTGVSMHTYKGDIEQTMRVGEHSVSSMITTQSTGASTAPTTKNSPTSTDSYDETKSNASAWSIAIGVTIFLGAAAILGFAYWIKQNTSTLPAITPLKSTFIRIDDEKDFVVASKSKPTNTLQQLSVIRDNISLATGLISRLKLLKEGTTTPTTNGSAPQITTIPMTSQEFLVYLNSGTASFARALSSEFLLGVHVTDGHQSFLIFKTGSYSQVYAGMLVWEQTMRSDLSPLFGTYLPPQTSENAGAGLTYTQTTTPTTTSATITQIKPASLTIVSTTTTNSTTTPVITEQTFVQHFIDKIIENHDTRVMQDEQGKTLLIWTFIDRNTLVITTSAQTLHEIISRLADAPVVPTQ